MLKNIGDRNWVHWKPWISRQQIPETQSNGYVWFGSLYIPRTLHLLCADLHGDHDHVLPVSRLQRCIPTEWLGDVIQVFIHMNLVRWWVATSENENELFSRNFIICKLANNTKNSLGINVNPPQTPKNSACGGPKKRLLSSFFWVSLKSRSDYLSHRLLSS